MVDTNYHYSPDPETPAFPVPAGYDASGMTVRVWLTGQVASAFVTAAFFHPDGDPVRKAAETAKLAVTFADALIAALNTPKGK